MSAQLAQALRWLIAELPVRVTNDQQLIHLSAAHIEGIGQACVKVLQAIEAAPQQEPAITVTIDDLDLVQDWAESRLPPGTHKLYAAPQQAQAPTQAEVDLNEALLEVDYWKRIAAHLAAPVGYKLVPIREAQQAQAPGWQLVPVEPTPEMLEAGEDARQAKERDMFSPTPTEFHDECGGPMGYAWLAMLKAAPQQGSNT